MTSYHSLLRSDSLGLGFLNRDVSASDLKKMVKSRSRIFNEGLGISAGLGFYHSIPLNGKGSSFGKKWPECYFV